MAKPRPLAEQLAQELGFKSVDDLKKAVSGGGDFAGGVSSRLEQGAGFGTAFAGGAADVKEGLKRTLNPKRLAKTAYKEFFGGDDIFSAYMRGRLNKKDPTKDGEKQEGDSGTSPTKDSGDLGAESIAVLNIIAKNSMSLPGIARDMNVLRQNLVKLVKLQPGGKEKARTKADAWFLREDERETALEVQKNKEMEKGKKVAGATQPEEKGGFLEGILGSIMDFFGKGFLGSITSLFSPAMLLKAITKVFLPAVLIGSLVNGIIDGWKKWQETGSLKDAIIAGLGGIVSFLTFGLFGEDEIKKAFDAVSSFVDPIVDSIADTFDSLKMWVVNNIGIPKISLPSISIPGWLQKLGAPEKFELGSIGPYYPFKQNPKSTEPEKSERQQKQEAQAAEGGDKSKSGGGAETKPAETSSGGGETSTKASPESKSSSEQASLVEKEGGVKIKLNTGVTYDASSGKFAYKGVTFEAKNQDEMDKFTKAIDNKSVVEFQGKDTNGPATIKFDGSTGERTVSAPQETATPTAVTQTKPAEVGGGGGGAPAAGAISASGGGGAPAAEAAAPSAEASPTAPSGAALSTDSAEVAQGQRLDSAADAGITVNAPVTNNESKEQGKKPSLIADAWNRDFIDSYTFAG